MLLALSSIGFVLVAVGYVLIIRRFMYAALDEVIRSGPGGETMRSDLMNIFAGLVLPQWVLICLVAVTLFFGFRVGLLWSIEHRRLAEELKRANATLQKSAISDSMTGLLNRAYLLESLLRELSAAHRHGTPLSCVILDIDRFKQVNDRYGHLAGDEVIRLTGRLIAERARGADIVARFGGEEFVCLMPRTTAEDALTVAEDLRRRIREQELVIDGERMRITASFGVAEATEMDQPWTPEKLLHLADRALYRAKDLGRDRCVRSIELEVGSDQISV